MLIAGPVVGLDVTIFKVSEGCHRKLTALADNLSTHIVLHTLRGPTLREFNQLVDQDILQVIDLGLIFLINLLECDLILCLRLTVLDGTLEQFLVDDDTGQRRVGLQ